MKRGVEQPCSTSGQLAECGQNGHVFWPDVPLQQKKIETHFAELSKKEKNFIHMKTGFSILSNLKFQFQHPMAENPLSIGLMGILISCKMLKRNNLHVCTCIYPLKCMVKFDC